VVTQFPEKHLKVREKPAQIMHQLLFFQIKFHFKHKNSSSGFNEPYIKLGKNCLFFLLNKITSYNIPHRSRPLAPARFFIAWFCKSYIQHHSGNQKSSLILLKLFHRIPQTWICFFRRQQHKHRK